MTPLMFPTSSSAHEILAAGHQTPLKSTDGRGQNTAELSRDFDSILTSMLVKELRSTLDDGLFAVDKTDSLGAIFDIYMGQALAQSGGLGLGDAIVSQLLDEQLPRPIDKG